MLICIPEILSKAEVADFRRLMDAVDWEDGRSTAGAQSALVKKNAQLSAQCGQPSPIIEELASEYTGNLTFV